ncbi:unnamed protein product [Acanthoscelides obtectus]|uniref:Uncharacterized protein n=1 Tax=Acanthoscelides obtectus TaxID=200917 RepID=A0A9P0KPV2_ACAOB|nr:unnamed protein product [Acanthoscelides obtectus]CAK1655972.1 hypothetical protein AOBTE_LOCUS19482 [Acanthoscelides obtectus]
MTFMAIVVDTLKTMGNAEIASFGPKSLIFMTTQILIIAASLASLLRLLLNYGETKVFLCIRLRLEKQAVKGYLFTGKVMLTILLIGVELVIFRIHSVCSKHFLQQDFNTDLVEELG